MFKRALFWIIAIAVALQGLALLMGQSYIPH
jgi:hypothetical protein